MAEFYKKPDDDSKFKITEEECEKLKRAFKEPEFRKLFQDYVEEISDPENRKIYEEEILALEKEQGFNSKFIHPTPCYVIKCLNSQNKKVFINICSNKDVEKPTIAKDTKGKGFNCSIPHMMSPLRRDLDKAYKECTVVDVIFNPDSINMASDNSRLKDMLQSIALEGIEKQYKTELNRTSLKFPKLKYKGNPNPLLVKEKSSSKTVIDEPLKQAAKKEKPEETLPSIVPKYQIKYLKNVNLQEFAYKVEPSSRPMQIVLEVFFPLLKSVDELNLEIFEKRILLETKDSTYRLDLALSYPVNDQEGSAKYDATERKLTVILPIIPRTEIPLQVEWSTSVEVEDGTLIDPVSEERDDAIVVIKEQCACLLNETKHSSFPSFEIDQTREFLIFIFKIKGIEQESIKTVSCKEHACHWIVFTSIGAGLVPFSYSFHFATLEKSLSPEEVTRDLHNSLVIRWRKQEESYGFWTQILAGVEQTALESFAFPCKTNLIARYKVLLNEETGTMLDDSQVEVQAFSPSSAQLKINFNSEPSAAVVPESGIFQGLTEDLNVEVVTDLYAQQNSVPLRDVPVESNGERKNPPELSENSISKTNLLVPEISSKFQCSCLLDETKHSSFPSFEIDQTQEFLIFIFKIKGIEQESVKTIFCKEHSCQWILFTSIDSGLVPLSYSFHFLTQENKLIPEEVTHDLHNSLVIRWKKEETSYGFWNQILAGVNGNAMEYFKFPCKTNLIAKYKVLLNEENGIPLENSQVEVKEFSAASIQLNINLNSNLSNKTTNPETIEEGTASQDDNLNAAEDLNPQNSIPSEKSYDSTQDSEKDIPPCPPTDALVIDKNIQSDLIQQDMAAKSSKETFVAEDLAVKDYVLEKREFVEESTKCSAFSEVIAINKIEQDESPSNTKDLTEQSNSLKLEASGDNQILSQVIIKNAINRQNSLNESIFNLSFGAPRKTRTLSGSCIEQGTAKPFHSILKRYSRSFSESGCDDWCVSDPDLRGSKKTVTFNEHKAINYFRPNSSILGQRKKNQRKAKNRKRHRSESSGEESTGTEECELTSTSDKSDLEDEPMKMEVECDDEIRTKLKNLDLASGEDYEGLKNEASSPILIPSLPISIEGVSSSDELASSLESPSRGDLFLEDLSSKRWDNCKRKLRSKKIPSPENENEIFPPSDTNGSKRRNKRLNKKNKIQNEAARNLNDNPNVDPRLKFLKDDLLAQKKYENMTAVESSTETDKTEVDITETTDTKDEISETDKVVSKPKVETETNNNHGWGCKFQNMEQLKAEKTSCPITFTNNVMFQLD